MNQRALIDVESAINQPAWAVSLKLRRDWHQNRATKHLGIGTDVLALVASDTDMHQATSQTFLSVVTLSVIDGKIENSKERVIGEAAGPKSSWVDDTPAGFAFRRERPS